MHALFFLPIFTPLKRKKGAVMAKIYMLYPENAPEVNDAEVSEVQEFHWPVPVAATYLCTAVFGLMLLFLQGMKVLMSVMAIVHDGYVYAPTEHSMNAYWYATLAVLICQLLSLAIGAYVLVKIPEWLLCYQRYTTRRMRKAWKRHLTPRKAWKYYLRWNIPAVIVFFLCYHYEAHQKGGARI